MAFLILILLNLIYNSNGMCNFVEFSLEMAVPPIGYQSLGIFSLSMNKCQTIKTLIDYNGLIDQEIKGSLQFTCKLDVNYVILTRYSDEYCSDIYIENTTLLTINDEEYLINNLIKIKIKDMACNDNNCMVSSAFGEDCSFSESKYYFNISFPPNKCETLSTSLPVIYQAIIENIESEVLPSEFALELSESSIKFGCCQDYSLMIYNYSDSKCMNESNVIRIPNTLNDVCLNISNYRRRRTLLNEYIIRQRRLQQAIEASSLVLSWTCDEVIECTEEFNTDLPPRCADTCTDWAWNPVTSMPPSNIPTSNVIHMPTMNPTIYNLSMTIKPFNSNLGVKNTRIVIILIGIFVLLLVILIVIYTILRYKSMSKQIISQHNPNQANIGAKNDSKYAAMIEESMNDDIIVSAILPESISNFDDNNINDNINNNEPISYENENYIKVETLNDGI